jgi:hypothetical protein
MEGPVMTIRARRLVSAGALAVAAVAAPLAIALTGGTGQALAGPNCLAWYGNQEDGHCLSYSNGNGVNMGTPWGLYGPNGSPGGFGGPMLPGTTWTKPLS